MSKQSHKIRLLLYNASLKVSKKQRICVLELQRLRFARCSLLPRKLSQKINIKLLIILCSHQNDLQWISHIDVHIAYWRCESQIVKYDTILNKSSPHLQLPFRYDRYDPHD